MKPLIRLASVSVLFALALCQSASATSRGHAAKPAPCPTGYAYLLAGYDGDHDGWINQPAAITHCVGASTVINGRTYYTLAGETAVWLGSSQIVGIYDPDDNYPRLIAGSTRKRSVRSRPCNMVSGRMLDKDGDLATVGEAQTKCVEGIVLVFDLYSHPVVRYVVDGRTEWISAADSIGEDCDDYNPNVFQLLMGGTDEDHDGYVREDKAYLFCVGKPVAIGDKYYFTNYAGLPIILPQDQILGYNDSDDYDPTKH